jgi:hypothetical protein
MVVATSFLIGLTAALLRSMLAIILVAFLIATVFVVALCAHGALWINLLIAIACFNAGLIFVMAAYVTYKRLHSA